MSANHNLNRENLNSMIRLIFSTLMLMIAYSVNGQILTVTANVKSNVLIDYDVTVQQHFHFYPDEAFKKQRFSNDYVQLSKRELIDFFDSNAFVYSEKEKTIDTITYRNTEVIELIDTIYHYAISKPNNAQLKALKELNPNMQNNVICTLNNVDYQHTDEFYHTLAQDAINTARAEVDKLAKALGRSVTDLYEVDMVSLFPNLTALDKTAIPLNTFSKPELPVTLSFKVSFNTVSN